MSKVLINSQWFVALYLLVTIVVNAGDYTYTTNSDGSLTITDYTGPGGVVTIPSVIDGRTVTHIGDWALSGGWFIPEFYLTSVTIPDSITSIGRAAFYSDKTLTNVMIGTGVTNIGTQAFYDCWSLPSITIPNSVTSIAGDAFGGAPA